jgi:ElaB/YqjD/DUF883 family membrane-anchored ribosome-binding protein
MSGKTNRLIQRTWMLPFSVLALGCLAGQFGCRGSSLALPQSLSGLGSASRVPPPATGSFQVPGTYNNGAAGTTSSSSGLGPSTFGPPQNSNPTINGQRTSQITTPVTNFVNSISNAQNELLKQTNQAVEQVNRVTENVNSRVEQASARVDRLGEGVVQASNILSDAAFAPVEPMQSGRISDQGATNTNLPAPVADASAWRTPK